MMSTDRPLVSVIVPVRNGAEYLAGCLRSVLDQTYEPLDVIVVDRVFDAASGTFRVRADLPNPDLALPGGLRCQVQFELDAPLPAAPQ